MIDEFAREGTTGGWSEEGRLCHRWVQRVKRGGRVPHPGWEGYCSTWENRGRAIHRHLAVSSSFLNNATLQRSPTCSARLVAQYRSTSHLGTRWPATIPSQAALGGSLSDARKTCAYRRRVENKAVLAQPATMFSLAADENVRQCRRSSQLLVGGVRSVGATDHIYAARRGRVASPNPSQNGSPAP
jgi:hypothetical protein